MQTGLVRCEVCAQFRHQQRKEPLMSTQLPDRPWQQLGSDLFEYRGKHYLLIVDYFSLDFRKSVYPTTRAQLLSSLLAVTSLRVMVFPNDSLVITDHNTLARSFVGNFTQSSRILTTSCRFIVSRLQNFLKILCVN